MVAHAYPVPLVLRVGVAVFRLLALHAVSEHEQGFLFVRYIIGVAVEIGKAEFGGSVLLIVGEDIPCIAFPAMMQAVFIFEFIKNITRTVFLYFFVNSLFVS